MGSSGINAVHGDRDISRLQVAQTLSSSTAFIHYIDPLSFFGLCKITFSHSFHLQSRLVRFAITVPTSQPDEETRLPFREKFLSYLQHVCEESRCHQRARRCCCCCAHGQARHCLGDGDACEHRHRPSHDYGLGERRWRTRCGHGHHGSSAEATTTSAAPVETSSSSYEEPSSYEAPSTSTSVYVAPTTSSSEYVAPTTTSTSEYVAPTTSSTSEYVAPTTTSVAPVPSAYEPSSTSAAPASTA